LDVFVDVDDVVISVLLCVTVYSILISFFTVVTG